MVIAVSFEIFIVVLLIFAPLFFKTENFNGPILIGEVFLPPKSPPGPKNIPDGKKSAPAPKKKVEPKEEKNPPPAEEKLQSLAEIPQIADTGENSNGKDESKENTGEDSENGSNAGPGEGCNPPNCVPGGAGEPESKEKEPPPPSPPPKPPRSGGKVKQAKLIHKVEPIYPELAKKSRVQGDVILEAVIGLDGNTHNIKVISGHALLRQSAVNAVKQWKYEPATLNGDPIEVATTITVKFILK